MRTICIPTTLSAGEYSASAGCTDTAVNEKQSFGHPLMTPKTVLLDPRASIHTPEWLFLSTGIRAVDHAVEDICSVFASRSPKARRSRRSGCSAGATGVKDDPIDIDARLECQLGAWLSMVGSQTGVPKGASHGSATCSAAPRMCRTAIRRA